MSCEGNRLKFFEQVQAALGLDAQTLERIYQTAKARGVRPDQQEQATQKTRWLFADMQQIGLKPPTHSADGLPKMESRAGYAAVFDHLRQNARARPRPDIPEADWPLPIHPDSLLDDNKTNGEGFKYHRYIHNQHVWMKLELGSGREEFCDFILGRPPLFCSDDEIPQMQAFCQTMDADGLLADGYTPEGFDRNGFDRFGYNIYGLTPQEAKDSRIIKEHASRQIRLFVRRAGRVNAKEEYVDIEGYSASDGFHPDSSDPNLDCDRFGFNRLGFKGGRSWTGYDEKGLDANGNPAPKRNGYDAWGYERKTGLTAPDSQGRRYNLIGWVYHPATDECYDPQNPAQRMKHSGSFGYSTKLKKVVLKRSYIPTEAELEVRLRNPSIRWTEFRNGGGRLFTYGCLQSSDQKALWRFNRPELRYLKSEMRLQANPNAQLMGVPLRCPKCGQFTGAAPHSCPQYDGRRTLVMSNGLVIAFERDAFRIDSAKSKSVYARNERFGDYLMNVRDVYDEMLANLNYLTDHLLPVLGGDMPKTDWSDLGRSYTFLNKLADLLWRKEKDETAVVLEAPSSPLEDFDPEYYGGFFPGYHWKSGLNHEGYDPYGFHYLSGRSRQGVHRHSLQAMMRVKAALIRASELLQEKGKDTKDVLEATYSRIATAIAGAARRVTITEEGGPRPGMFWTDMRGRIQAERYPLQSTPQNSEINNLLAMKAGIYHELGHEEDTPPGVFARILDIARGKEEVDGIPRSAAGLVAEVYNILEDGRMERVQAKRRRGTAAILAADALINPRWDEKVGDDLPVAHQVMGLMLYRALPFFHVRQEVLNAAPARVRKLYDEVQPLVDRAMRSPQDTFQSTIEITRRLIESDEAIRKFAEQMTAQKSQGGKWVFQPAEDGGNGSGTTLIISALPNIEGSAAPDQTLSLPPRGWGQQDEEQKDGHAAGQRQDEEQKQGRAAGQKQDEEQKQGRAAGQKQDEEQKDGRAAGQKQDEEQKQGRAAGQQQDEEQKQGRAAGQQQDDAGSSGGYGVVMPEVDEDFFRSVSGQVSLDDIFDNLASDLRQGINAILRSPVGKALQKPLEAVGDIVVENPSDPTQTFAVSVLRPKTSNTARRARNELNKIKAAAQAEGRRVARRLEVLKEEVRRKMRLQTSGTIDRKRFKRALAGAETVYRQMRSQDITSLAVSIQLDMSGSMHNEIASGRLASTALALEEALRKLDAEYMLTGFGSEYALIKTFGDERIRDEQAEAMLAADLGGTVAAPALRLGMLGLKETHSANKLHVVMTDGEFFDTQAAAAQAAEMRRNGIVPLGIFFQGNGSHVPAESLNKVFGEGGWVKINKLPDLSEVVARRIEQIYRKILATR